MTGPDLYLSMGVRLLQNVFAAANCFFGFWLLAIYGPALLQLRAWRPGLEEQVLVLVAGAVLPLAILAFRFPLIAGIAQFSAAYIGNQLLHDSPLPDLRGLSALSMALALAILCVALFRGIFEITQEAFGEAEDTDQRRSDHAARAA